MTHDPGGARRHHVNLERVPYDPAAWDAVVASHEDAEVFHGAAWLEFLAATQGAEPVVAVVRAGERPVGFFVGAIVRRYGIRILGSPLRGWTTQCMGFLLEEGFDRRSAAEALLPFAFKDLGCHHVELSDRHLTAEQMDGSSYEREIGTTFRIDLNRPEEEILGQIHRTTRKEIRRAVRAGLRVEIATDNDFSDEFYGYLRAVFLRQGLAPTYGPERVRALVRVLRPTGHLLLLRVRSPSGESLATSLSVGRNHNVVGWGMAFDRENDEYHPIELLWWETIRSWRSAGALMFDLAGRGEYKAKYGGVETPTVHFHRSRWPILRVGRSAIRRLAKTRQVLSGLLERLA